MLFINRRAVLVERGQILVLNQLPENRVLVGPKGYTDHYGRLLSGGWRRFRRMS
jgi:hypothetical protein